MEFADHLELSVPALDSAAGRDFLRAMNALSVEHRQILLLVGLEDLGYREIAEELDVPHRHGDVAAGAGARAACAA